MILVFILFSFLPLFWPFGLFTEVVRKIPGEVTRWDNESPQGSRQRLRDSERSSGPGR